MALDNPQYLNHLVEYSRKLFDLSGKDTDLAVEPKELEAMRNSGLPNIIVLMNFITMKVQCICGNVEQVVGCKFEELDGHSIERFYGLMTPKHQARFSRIAPELAASVKQRIEDGTINDSILNIQNQIIYQDAKGRNKWILAQVFHYFIEGNERVGAALQMTDLSSMVIHSTFSIHLYHKASERIIKSFSDSDPDSIHLTKREREIFELLYQGKMEKEIASTCEISLKTVKNHKQNVFKKLGVTRTIEATQKLEELGLI